MRSLNIATRPFRNERLPIALTCLLTAVALATTLAHALTLSRLLSSGLRQTESEVGRLEGELAQMRIDREQLRALNPSKEDLAQWDLVRQLVDRRVFRWTKLFARLAEVVPPDIKLTVIEPVITEDGVAVRLTATTTGGGSATLLKLVQRLESEPDFENVAPEAMADDERANEILLRLRYRPTDKPAGPTSTPGAAAAPAQGTRQ